MPTVTRTREFDLAVFIGRQQPPTKAHNHVEKIALERADNLLILMGSSFIPRTHRNPFHVDERIFIKQSEHKDSLDRIAFCKLQDVPYDDLEWASKVRTSVNFHIDGLDDPRVALIGHSKDSTSFYLKMFPEWDSVEVGNLDGINATDFRDSLFSGTPNWDLVTPECRAFVEGFQMSSAFVDLKKAWDDDRAYGEPYKDLPFPPIFQTVDAVVHQAGKILMVKRKNNPGRGLWALPGGFLEHREKIVDAIIRELCEETRIAVPMTTLYRCLVTTQTFDDPWRSTRGRTITTAGLIDLDSELHRDASMKKKPSMTKVKGADDAAEAKWISIPEINQSLVFEDHYGIIMAMIKHLGK